MSAWGPDRAHGRLGGGQDDTHGRECCHNLLAWQSAVMVVECMTAGLTWAPLAVVQVIAGRKTQGFIEGEILVNGHPKVQATWARSIGYVEQTGKAPRDLCDLCAIACARSL